MKKAIINISFIIIFLILYFLQINFFTWFRLAGIMPNLFIILVLFIGLFSGKVMGITYGLIFGILLDLFVGKKIGVTAIGLGIIGAIGGILDKNFSKDSRITIMIMNIGTTIIYEVIIYIINYFVLDTNIEILNFIKILFIEVIFNTILTIILYPLIQKFGNYIENEFKGTKILTRYF